MAKNWIEIEDRFGLHYQCTKCDYFCTDPVAMAEHQSFKHMKKPNYKRHKKDAENKLPLKGVHHGRFIP